jgi:hypothetical protein
MPMTRVTGAGYSLFPIPYSLFPIPYSLLPADPYAQMVAFGHVSHVWQSHAV